VTRLDPTRLAIGAAAIVALLLLGTIVTLRGIQALHEDASMVSHSREVLTRLSGVLSLTQEAESTQRRYLIVGDTVALASYREAVATLDERVDHLARLTRDNPSQQASVAELRTYLTARIGHLEHGIAVRQSDGFAAAQEFIGSGLGRGEMEGVRKVIGAMTQREHDLLEIRAAASARSYRSAVSAGVGAGLLTLASFVGFLLVLRAHLAARDAATRAVAEQRERLRTTLASIGDAVIATDTQRNVTLMNAVAESLTGWKCEEAMGMPLDTVFHIVNETTRQPVEHPAERALREGMIVGLANHTLLIARDGSERAIDDSAAPIRCAEGEIVGCVLVFRDITERRDAANREHRLYREARAATAQFRAFFDQGALFAGIVRPDGTVVETNRLALEAGGYTKEQVEDKPFWECPWWSPSPPLQARIKAAVLHAAGGEAFRAEMPYFVADGSQRMADIAISPILDDDGQVLFLAPIGTDITERKRLEQALRQLAADLSEANHRKDTFLALLAHELRNPLAPILSGLALIRSAKRDGPPLEVTVEMMERQIGHLVRLVDDLLDVSRISRGKTELRKEIVDLKGIVHQAIEANRACLEEMGHTLVVTIPDATIFLECDPVRLVQITDNLLNNACKYMAPNGRIELGVERNGDYAIVRVRDYGVGIEREDLTRIFDMFTQLDSTLERSQSGLGIGLTLVKNLVEMHGGTIEARSDGLGYGSEFAVRLPALAESASVPRVQAATDGDGRLVPRRILIVDDNRDAAESMAMLLDLMGHETCTAFDGLEALVAAASFGPDVILLDIGLPKLNGYEVARKLRDQPDGRSKAIVALTGWGQASDRQQAKDAGFDRHLVKPVGQATLARLLDELARSSG
jgi:PAS domain S-box-containing protein